NFLLRNSLFVSALSFPLSVAAATGCVVGSAGVSICLMVKIGSCTAVGVASNSILKDVSSLGASVFNSNLTGSVEGAEYTGASTTGVTTVGAGVSNVTTTFSGAGAGR